MADTLTIRPMEAADLPGVLETLRAALGETPLLKRTPDLWGWKHQLNPFGNSIVLVAAESDGRIAGVRALMRWRLATPTGGELSCVRAVDTAVHPDYQRRGLFRSMNESALEVARNDGVDLVFNTPNSQSRPGYLKQGWRDVGAIGVMVRPTWRLLNPRRELDELPAPSELLPEAKAAADLSEDDRVPVGLRTVRSEGYRAWRFGSHPTAEYVSVGSGDSTAVLRVNRRSGRDELVVSELIGDQGSKAIRRAAKLARAGYFVAWFSRRSPERAAAMRAGLVPIPRVTALNLVARPLTTLDLDVFDLDNWDIALSDLELL
ncbi:MAG: GNAT family N-acetyltransferase [Acidimicrobiia bacterium]|nr:GNAT family N-acetyltransferase [Acidimicrobiia bacterium]